MLLTMLSLPQAERRTSESWRVIRQVCPADWTPPCPVLSARPAWLQPPPVPWPAYPRCCNRLRPPQSRTDHLGSKSTPIETLACPSAESPRYIACDAFIRCAAH